MARLQRDDRQRQAGDESYHTDDLHHQANADGVDRKARGEGEADVERLLRAGKQVLHASGEFAGQRGLLEGCKARSADGKAHAEQNEIDGGHKEGRRTRVAEIRGI